jgi:predicted restriction endonuclease
LILPESKLIERFDQIRVWQQGDRRAVHKPLLVLLMLVKLARAASASFSDVLTAPNLGDFKCPH